MERLLSALTETVHIIFSLEGDPGKPLDSISLQSLSIDHSLDCIGSLQGLFSAVETSGSQVDNESLHESHVLNTPSLGLFPSTIDSVDIDLDCNPSHRLLSPSPTNMDAKDGWFCSNCFCIMFRAERITP